MKTYLIRSIATGEFRRIAPCDAREGADDHTKFTRDADSAASVFLDDTPDDHWLQERGLELVDAQLLAIAAAQAAAPGARVEVKPAGQVLRERTEAVPERVSVAGAEFDVVRQNADGTLTLKSDGGEFDTALNEPWTPVVVGNRNYGKNAGAVSREEFQRAAKERLRGARRIKLLEVENEIQRAWKPAKRLPVGVNKVAAFESLGRHTAEQRQLLARLQNARRDLAADMRTDVEHAGRVWDAINKPGVPSV